MKKDNGKFCFELDPWAGTIWSSDWDGTTLYAADCRVQDTEAYSLNGKPLFVTETESERKQREIKESKALDEQYFNWFGEVR